MAINKKQAAGGNTSSKLQEKIAECQKIPTPTHNPDWNIEPIAGIGEKRGWLKSLIKKRDVKDEVIAELRRSAINAPGNTRVHIIKMQKKFPDNPSLMILSAICQQGMIASTANQKDVINGLSMATKDSVIALLSDGISLYNVESFLKIYFMYLDRFKRMQIRTYEQTRLDPRLESHKKGLQNTMHMVDFLSGDKKKSFAILAHMKKKLKTSHYTTYFHLTDIATAAQHIENGLEKEKLTIGSSKELIAYTYALCIAFARIPILSELTDMVLEKIPEINSQLYLRKVSIRSVRHFTLYRLYSLEGNREKMKNLGKAIYNENATAIQKVEGLTLHQVYESDPYFNLAYIAELTFGLFEPKVQEQMLNAALKAVENVIQRDMSNNHVFTDAANSHTHKLSALKEAT
ncbi:MAG: hypothetical protein GY786_16880 [Proteobacteria bacterium]|nr:hypothetical protein [Pseudomonadota bacterium]